MGTGLGSAGMGLGSGTTSQGYSSGIEPRPRMADKNASTISIKSGVMGHDDTETLHEPSTSQPAHNANAMKPFPGMPSAGYSGASSGLTGSSLPDRSVATSGRLVLPYRNAWLDRLTMNLIALQRFNNPLPAALAEVDLALSRTSKYLLANVVKMAECSPTVTT